MLERIGRATRERLRDLMYGLGFFYNVLKESALFFRRNQVGYRVLVMQILFTGYEALRISAVLALALGVGGYLAGRVQNAPVVEATLAKPPADLNELMPESPFEEDEDPISQLSDLSPEDAELVLQRLESTTHP